MTLAPLRNALTPLGSHSLVSVPSPLLTLLYGYWTFDDASGTFVSDSSGNGHTGTWNGTLGSQWTAGKINDGGKFNGIDNYVQLGNFGLANAAACSVALWVKFAAIGSDEFLVDESGTSNYGGGLSIRLKSAGTPRFWSQDAGFFVDAVTTVTTNVWYHLVGTCDTTNNRIYINGTLNNTASIGSQQVRNTVPLQIGHSQVLGGFSNAVIDEVGLWTRALTAAEVTALYNGGAGNQYPF